MKILHISDLHLGKIINGFSMIEDQKYILNQIPQIIIDNQIETVVIAGDIYDRSIAPVDAVELWSDFLKKVASLAVNTLIINGNHDSMKRLGFASDLFSTSNIHIVSRDVLFEKITLNNINFYLLPFLSLEQASHILGQKVTDFNQLKQLIIAQIDLDQTQKNVIVDHSYIITDEHDIEQDSAIRPLSLGGSEFTTGAVYNQFDLVLAGHIHRHSHIRPNIYYSGSILPYSVGECQNKSGYYIHNMNNEISSSYHHFQLLHPMRRVELYIDQLQNQTYSEDYIIIKLLDQGQLINPLEKIRHKFPNVMQIDRNFSTNLVSTDDFRQQETIEATFTEFFNLNSEYEITDNQLNYFIEKFDSDQEGERNETT